MITLNETPVRTAKNFNINNIKIDSLSLPKNIESFDNIDVNIPEGTTAKNECSKVNLKYGLGESIIDEINEKANSSLSVLLEGKQEEPITIFCDLDEDNPVLIQNIEILAKEKSKANLVIKYKAQAETECYHNVCIRTILKKDANINITVVNLTNTKSTAFLSIENEIAENAKLNYIIVDFGGKNSITNYFSNLVRKFFKK